MPDLALQQQPSFDDEVDARVRELIACGLLAPDEADAFSATLRKQSLPIADRVRTLVENSELSSLLITRLQPQAPLSATLRSRRAQLESRLRSVVREADLEEALRYLEDVRTYLIQSGTLMVHEQPELASQKRYEELTAAAWTSLSAYSAPTDEATWEKEIQHVGVLYQQGLKRTKEQRRAARGVLMNFPQHLVQSSLTADERTQVEDDAVEPGKLLPFVQRVKERVRPREQDSEPKPERVDAIDEVFREKVQYHPGARYTLDRKARKRAAVSGQQYNELGSSDLDSALQGPFDAAMLDVDGVLVDNYDDRESPILDLVEAHAAAGTRMALCSGRSADKLMDYFKSAKNVPGLVIYGKNGMDVWRSNGDAWIRSEPIIATDIQSRQKMERAVDTMHDELESIRKSPTGPGEVVIERNKKMKELLSITIVTIYRSTSHERHVDEDIMADVLADLERRGFALPPEFEFQNAGDACQIRPKGLGKVACVEHFQKHHLPPNARVMRLADQGGGGKYREVNGVRRLVARGGDYDFLDHPDAFSTDALADGTDPKLPRSRGHKLPYKLTKGARYALERGMFRVSDLIRDRIAKENPDTLALLRRVYSPGRSSYAFLGTRHQDMRTNLIVNVRARGAITLDNRMLPLGKLPYPQHTMELLAQLTPSPSMLLPRASLPFPWTAEGIEENLLAPLRAFIHENTGEELGVFLEQRGERVYASWRNEGVAAVVYTAGR